MLWIIAKSHVRFNLTLISTISYSSVSIDIVSLLDSYQFTLLTMMPKSLAMNPSAITQLTNSSTYMSCCNFQWVSIRAIFTKRPCSTTGSILPPSWKFKYRFCKLSYSCNFTPLVVPIKFVIFSMFINTLLYFRRTAIIVGDVMHLLSVWFILEPWTLAKLVDGRA